MKTPKIKVEILEQGNWKTLKGKWQVTPGGFLDVVFDDGCVSLLRPSKWRYQNDR